MAIQINEQRMVEENIFRYEQRLKSPIRRFSDKSFVPVRYWHIKANATTVDKGYGDVAEILGKTSPVKFQYIENLPIYGLETFILQLQTTEQGLDTSFESEAIIMEGTIRPLPNDYFMIGTLKDSYIFRITGVDYDMLASEQSYKISFILEYIDNEKVEELKDQTTAEFTCIMENIGTDERCIIEKGDSELLTKIDKMYDEMVNSYITFYYNKRYGCLLGDYKGGKLFDPFQCEFIRDHQLFHRKNEIDSMTMIQQFSDPKRKIKYQKSIYRFFELKKLDHLTSFPYITFTGSSNHETAFYRWLDASVQVVDIQSQMDPKTTDYVMPDQFRDKIKMNYPTDTKYGELIRRFIRETLTIHDIDLGLADEILLLDDANLEVFFYTPILLYIIKETVNEHLKNMKDIDNVENVQLGEVL